LPGAAIAVHGHPEYGQTLSRMDGAFDMAVNGGEALVVDYALEGYLPAQRQVGVPWQDYAWLPDVVAGTVGHSVGNDPVNRIDSLGRALGAVIGGAIVAGLVWVGKQIVQSALSQVKGLCAPLPWNLGNGLAIVSANRLW
jgi:hypothetical protein